MLICMTNRKLCRDDFLPRVSLIAKGKPHGIILREKDLSIAEYERLAVSIKEICDTCRVPLIIHQKITVAAKLKHPLIHLTMADLKRYRHELKHFLHIGASVHSVEEAKEAEALGASCLIAGHIFATGSKKGVPPRGLSFLKEVCAAVTLPVLAIGGITKDKVEGVLKAGADGICVMTGPMTCPNPLDFNESLLQLVLGNGMHPAFKLAADD